MILELDDIFQKKGYSEQEFRLDIAITLYQKKWQLRLVPLKLRVSQKLNLKRHYKSVGFCRSLMPMQHSLLNDEFLTLQIIAL